jgi:hypothetical protein
VTVRFAAPRHLPGANIQHEEFWKVEHPYVAGNAARADAPGFVRTTGFYLQTDPNYQQWHDIARKPAATLRRHATDPRQVIVTYAQANQGYTIASGETAMVLRTNHAADALAYGGTAIPVRTALPVLGGSGNEVAVRIAADAADAGSVALSGIDVFHPNFMREGAWDSGIARWHHTRQAQRIRAWVQDGGHAMYGGQHSAGAYDWPALEARLGTGVARAMFEAEYRFLHARIADLDPSRIVIGVENEPAATSLPHYLQWLGDYAFPFLRGLFPDHTIALPHPAFCEITALTGTTGALPGDRNTLSSVHFYHLWEAASERAQFRAAMERSLAGGRGGIIVDEIGFSHTVPDRYARTTRCLRAIRDVGGWAALWVFKAQPDADTHSTGYRDPAGNWIIREDFQDTVRMARRPVLRAAAGVLVGGRLITFDTTPVRQPWTPPAPPAQQGGHSGTSVTWNPPTFAGLVAHMDASAPEVIRTSGDEAAPVYAEINGPGGVGGQSADWVSSYVQAVKVRQGAQAGAWVNKAGSVAWTDHIGGPYHGIYVSPGSTNRGNRENAGLFLPTISAGGTSSFTITMAVTVGRGHILGVSGAAWSTLLEITENTLRLFSDSALDVTLPMGGWASAFDNPNDNLRTHVITLRSRAGVVDVYLDGALLGVRNCTAKPARTAALVVGNDRQVGDFSPNPGAIGWYHDVFQYDVALSDADMAALHAACLARYAVRGLRRQIIAVLHGQSNAEYLTDHGNAANGGTLESRLAVAAIRQALGAVNLRRRWSKVVGQDLSGTGTMRGGCALDVWVDTSSGIGNQDTWDWTTIDVGASSRNFYTSIGAAGTGARHVVIFYHNEYDAARGPSAKAMYKATVRAFIRLVRRDAQFQVPILLCGPMPYVSSVPAGGLQMTAEVFDEVAAELPAVHRILRNLGDLGFSQDSGHTTFGNPHQHWTDSIKVYQRLGREIGKVIGFDNAPAMGTGPAIASATGSAAGGTVDVTVTHDGGTDLVVPTAAQDGRGWRVMQGANQRSVAAAARLNATSIRLTVAGLTAGAATVAYAEGVANFWSGAPPLPEVLIRDNTDTAGDHPAMRAGLRTGMPLHRRPAMAFSVSP